jgi:predicted PurR-regulated permease PerM
VSREELPARRFLFALLVGALVAIAFIARPLAGALLLGSVLAVALMPLQRRLTRWLGNRPQVAAAILVLASLVLVVAPILAMSTVAVREATEGVRFVLETLRNEGASGLLDRLPSPFNEYAQRLLAYLGDVGNIAESQVHNQGGKAASAVGAALVATGSLLFQMAMMLIALFFLLVSGRELIIWIDGVSPLRRGQTHELLTECRKVSYAVLVSTLVTAAVQTAVALVGYLIAGVPQIFFFTGVTFFFALIPAIGAATVCLVAALVLLITGHPYMAIFLAVWGLGVVGLVDNVVKPYLIKGDVEMHGAVVFFSLIGGIAAFGMIGLLAGPLAMAMLLALLRMYHRDYLSTPVDNRRPTQ